MEIVGKTSQGLQQLRLERAGLERDGFGGFVDELGNSVAFNETGSPLTGEVVEFAGQSQVHVETTVRIGREGFVDTHLGFTSMTHSFQLAEAPICSVPEGVIAGDLDGDGEVAFADFLRLSANFGNSDVSYAEGDTDCNGEIDFADFLTLSANFGQTSVGAEPVPEPSTGILLLTGWLCALACRRHSYNGERP